MASGGFYSYKFPEINMDNTTNYPSAAGIIKKITAEEWADMLHHTHKITEIVDANGNKLGSGADGTITAYDDTEIKASISTLESKVQTLENNQSQPVEEYDDTELKGLIQTLQQQVANLIEENTTLKESVTTLQSKVQTLENNSSASTDGLIIDYDIDKQGTQDIHGNDTSE